MGTLCILKYVAFKENLSKATRSRLNIDKIVLVISVLELANSELENGIGNGVPTEYLFNT